MIVEPTTLIPTVFIQNRLLILGNNRVAVPMCEPATSITSVSLLAAQQNICHGATVDLAEALEAIPGSTIEFVENTGPVRERYFVLPPNLQGCCQINPDWYRVLRNLESVQPAEPEPDHCSVIDQSWCPSPGFKSQPPPEPSPYHTEGTGLIGLGLLT